LATPRRCGRTRQPHRRDLVLPAGIEKPHGISPTDIPDEYVTRVQPPERRFPSGRAAECRDCRRETLVMKAPPGVLVRPDADDAEPFFGRTGYVEYQPLGQRFQSRGRDTPVQLPGGRNLLYERVCHRSGRRVETELAAIRADRSGELVEHDGGNVQDAVKSRQPSTGVDDG